MQSPDLYIAIDIGGTHIRVARFSSIEMPEFKDFSIFALSHVFEEDFDRMTRAIRQLVTGPVTAIGISIPGVLNTEKSFVAAASNIPEWIGKNITDTLAQEFSTEVYMDNDAVTGSLSEVEYGKTTNDFLFLIWGTGVGGTATRHTPNLAIHQLETIDYPEDLRRSLYGKALLEKYARPLNELDPAEWSSIFSDFEKFVRYVCEHQRITEVIVAGGVALNQTERIMQLAKHLEHSAIRLRATRIGNSFTFGLYGAAALIASKL